MPSSIAATSDLTDALRARWTRSPYPMLVDAANGERICPAPSLYLGAKRWAGTYQDQGHPPGTVIILDAKPSAQTLMKVIGALRVGLRPRLARRGMASSDVALSDDFRGLAFGDDPPLSEEELVAMLLASSPDAAAAPVFFSAGPWWRRSTWAEELWPALAQGAEVHVNVDPLDLNRDQSA